MKFEKLTQLLLVLLLVPAAAFAHDGETHDEEATVNNAVAHYSAIGSALAADSVDGVADHAHGILAIMDAHMAEGGDHHAKMEEHAGDHGDNGDMDMDMEKMEAMHESMRTALEVLAAKDTDLEAAREAYKTLSANFVPMAQKMYAKSEMDPEWAVMMCPMVKAEWIQVDGKTANPYYGSKMLRCGKKVSDLAAGGQDMDMKDMDHDNMNHEGHGEHKEHHHGG